MSMVFSVGRAFFGAIIGLFAGLIGLALFVGLFNLASAILGSVYHATLPVLVAGKSSGQWPWVIELPQNIAAITGTLTALAGMVFGFRKGRAAVQGE